MAARAAQAVHGVLFPQVYFATACFSTSRNEVCPRPLDAGDSAADALAVNIPKAVHFMRTPLHAAGSNKRL